MPKKMRIYVALLWCWIVCLSVGLGMMGQELYTMTPKDLENTVMLQKNLNAVRPYVDECLQNGSGLWVWISEQPMIYGFCYDPNQAKQKEEKDKPVKPTEQSI